MAWFRIRRKRYSSGLFLDPDEILVDSVSALGAGNTQEGKLERPLTARSSFLLLLVMGAGIVYLAIRSASLQIASGAEFFKRSQENRFIEQSILPPRGIIYDHFGVPLVENNPYFGLLFDREDFRKEDMKLHDLLDTLSVMLEEPDQYFFEAGFPKDYNDSALPEQIIIAENISPDHFLKLGIQLHSLPGVRIFENYRRVYRSPDAYAHVIGYVGKVSQEDIDLKSGFSYEEMKGKSGIELEYDELLRGVKGKKIIEVDSRGRETAFQQSYEAGKGTGLALTLDGELQEFIGETLERFIKGERAASVVIMDPRDGGVRALVSYPSFNANSLSTAITKKELDLIQENPLKPFFNRTIAGEFPSGSIFKPLIGAGALTERIIDPNEKILTKGYIEIPNPYSPGEKTIFPDWKNHGAVNFYDALSVSSNVYFYTIGGGYQGRRGLGADLIHDYAMKFGLGEETGIDIPGERAGIVPSPDLKKKLEPANPVWRVGDTYNFSIGQGGLLVTPLQMTAAIGAIANGGTLYRPYLLERIVDDGGFTPVVGSKQGVIREGFVSKSAISDVVKGMKNAASVGTARLLATVPVASAAKTGTAQIGDKQRPHAWVVAFFPLERPEVAMTVMVEHAGEGSTVAVPIMREIAAWYVSHRLNK